MSFQAWGKRTYFQAEAGGAKITETCLVDGVEGPCSLGSPSSVAAVGNMPSTSSSKLCRLWLLRAPHSLFQMKVASMYVCGEWQYTSDVGQ